MPDASVFEAVTETVIIGSEWKQIRQYLDSGEYSKAMALLKLLHE
jgi:hypothetical protein